MENTLKNRGSWRGTKSLSKASHEPVLLNEAIEFLNVKNGGRYIDATVGAGGHAGEICARGGNVLGMDWDKEALATAKRHLKDACPDIVLVHANFAKIADVAKVHGFVPVDGVLFDLGISSMQLKDETRGFSFQSDSPLDMRMNKEEQGVTAADLLNGLREDQLYELFAQTTQKNVARAVARTVVRARGDKRIERTSELVNLVNEVYGGRARRISPATTIFMALRMAVNSELENLEKGLEGGLEVLGHKGRLVVISFHSGEDRIVKNFLRAKSKEGEMLILTKKPVRPTDDEVYTNPRARSARLRAGEKLRT